MGEEPQLPPIPDLGEILYRKDRFFERKSTVVKCSACYTQSTRAFKPGDFTFKQLQDECSNCHRKNTLTVAEIYSEWIDPKKKS